jgi:hypothetical protein
MVEVAFFKAYRKVVLTRKWLKIVMRVKINMIIMASKQSLGDILCLLRFLLLLLLLSPQTKFWGLLVFALFLIIIIKSPNEVWRLIVFALFLIIIIKSPNEVWRLIVFAPFLISMAPKRSL